jgi:alpha-1,2-mannosyltransferase
VFGFATPVWSVAANGIWPHTVTLLGIAGMAWSAGHQRWWWVGVFGGVAIWGRIHVALIVAVLGVLVGWRRRDPGAVVRIAVASGAFLAGMCVWIRWMYGTWNPLGAYDSGTVAANADQYRFSLVNQLGMWVAPDRGILVWTPLVLLLLPALWRSWPTLPDWSRSLVWGGLVYTIVESALNTFTGGDIFYGYRYGLEFLGCAVPALAFAAPQAGRVARAVIGPVIGVQLFAIILGSVNDSAFLPQSEVWHDNAFVHTVNGAGLAGWVTVVMCALLGVVAGRLWPRPDRQAEAERTPAASRA